MSRHDDKRRPYCERSGLRSNRSTSECRKKTKAVDAHAFPPGSLLTRRVLSKLLAVTRALSPLRTLATLAVLFFATRALLASAATTATPQRPNILVILTDDQGYGDLSIHGNKLVETPNIDRFARGGIQFDRFFVSPVCAPTRASFLTGRWWQRGGVHGVTQGREVMRASEVTIAETLRAAGYRTGIFGKWHNGEQYPLTPIGQGFDEFLGFNAGHWNNYFDAELTRGSQPQQTKGYIGDVITDAAIAFVEKNRANPFFCYVPFNTPHSPHQVADRYFEKYRAKGCDPELAAIYGMCENIDDNVGRLLAALDRLALRENTIVIYFTDNGPGHSDRYNAAMRGKKASVHEGGTRVPCFLQFPARLREPRMVREIAAHIDLYPTLLDLSGVPVPKNNPKLDGVSLVPLLEGKNTGWPERMLFTHQAGGTGIPRAQPGAVRTSRYRAVIDGSANAQWQLYDMQADPAQATDIAKSQPDVVKSLSAAYTTWWQDVSREGFNEPAIPVGHSQHNPLRLNAPQADLSGKVRWFIPQGYANTWITGWTELADKIAFRIDVASAGTFEVSLAYACAPADAGAKIRITSENASNEITATVAPAPGERLPMAHRDGPKDNYVDRVWGTLPVGRLRLAAGEQTLTLQALSKPGEQVMDVRHVQLRRVE